MLRHSYLFLIGCCMTEVAVEARGGLVVVVCVGTTSTLLSAALPSRGLFVGLMIRDDRADGMCCADSPFRALIQACPLVDELWVFGQVEPDARQPGRIPPLAADSLEYKVEMSPFWSEDRWPDGDLVRGLAFRITEAWPLDRCCCCCCCCCLLLLQSKLSVAAMATLDVGETLGWHAWL